MSTQHSRINTSLIFQPLLQLTKLVCCALQPAGLKNTSDPCCLGLQGLIDAALSLGKSLSLSQVIVIIEVKYNNPG